MTKISDLSDELLVKILSFLPTKVAASTSVLSKQWEFLWMWSPDLEFNCDEESVRDFINQNLPLHRAPIINSLCLNDCDASLQAETFKSCVEIAVSRGLRELSIWNVDGESLFFPSSFYTCNSLVSLEINASWNIVVDVPRTVCLPSLKTLKLIRVTYSNEDSLRLLLSCCPVLEDLIIDRVFGDNVSEIVIKIRSLRSLSLFIGVSCISDVCVIVTPSLKHFDIRDTGSDVSYLIEHMPELEEADISLVEDNDDKNIEKILKSITTVKRLTVNIACNSINETVYGDDIVFSHLEKLKVRICKKNWSKILLQLLKDSPNLQILHLKVKVDDCESWEDKPVSWSKKQSSVPECLLKSLTTFTFKGSTKKEEERDFLTFIFKYARCLKTTSILR